MQPEKVHPCANSCKPLILNVIFFGLMVSFPVLSSCRGSVERPAVQSMHNTITSKCPLFWGRDSASCAASSTPNPRTEGIFTESFDSPRLSTMCNSGSVSFPAVRKRAPLQQKRVPVCTHLSRVTGVAPSCVSKTHWSQKRGLLATAILFVHPGKRLARVIGRRGALSLARS